MSSRTTDSNNSHRPARIREADQLIRDLAQLETGLGMEVQRLERLTAPAPGPLPAFRGQPVWWWREKLVAWAWSLRTEGRCALDALQGLRLVVTEWDDEQLVRFIDHSCSDITPSSGT